MLCLYWVAYEGGLHGHNNIQEINKHTTIKEKSFNFNYLVSVLKDDVMTKEYKTMWNV